MIVNLVYFFKETAFSFADFFVFFLVSISLISALFENYFSPSACFGYDLLLFF
jgi:hypothetical protein